MSQTDVVPDPALGPVLAEVHRRVASGASPRVLDLAGGTGRNAVPLAVAGARVVVLDRSADALAILARRADESGVAGCVHGVQADVESVPLELGPPGPDAAAFDVVLVHDVLDTIEDPTAALVAVLDRLGPDGLLSVVLANPVSAVVSRALAGQPAAARQRLAALRAAPAFGAAAAAQLAGAHGLRVLAHRGLDVFAGRVPGALLDGTHGTHDARTALAALDADVADDPSFAALAARSQVLLRRAGD